MKGFDFHLHFTPHFVKLVIGNRPHISPSLMYWIKFSSNIVGHTLPRMANKAWQLAFDVDIMPPMASYHRSFFVFQMKNNMIVFYKSKPAKLYSTFLDIRIHSLDMYQCFVCSFVYVDLVHYLLSLVMNAKGDQI